MWFAYSYQTMAEIALYPQAGRQLAFLTTPADIAIYGGSAGGGKTWGILADAVRDVDVPGYGATIFRRTYPEVTNQGGLWDESEKMYKGMKGQGVRGDLVWRWRTGARIEFGHCQHESDLDKWDGAQICTLAFDQLEHFTEKQFWYLTMRNRSLCGVPPRVRASCNPDPDSFLITGPDGWGTGLIAWWIDDDGYAILERAGVLRWFVRADEQIVWADRREDLVDAFPNLMPRSLTFIPATIYDNPILMETDPGYIAHLQGLGYIERMRFLGDDQRGGNWKVKAGAGKIFNRSWFKIVDVAPDYGIECTAWDLAATIKSLKNDDPDYTARVRMRRVGDDYYVMDMLNERVPAGQVESLMKTVTKQDQKLATSGQCRHAVRWEQEPGSASIRETVRLKQVLSEHDADGLSAYKDKVTRWKPFATASEHGHVYLVAGPWVQTFMSACHGVPDLPHDDIPDAGAIAYNYLVDQVVDEPEPEPNPWYQRTNL